MQASRAQQLRSSLVQSTQGIVSVSFTWKLYALYCALNRQLQIVFQFLPPGSCMLYALRRQVQIIFQIICVIFSVPATVKGMTLISHPDTDFVEIDDTVKLTCEVSARPAPIISWILVLVGRRAEGPRPLVILYS